MREVKLKEYRKSDSLPLSEEQKSGLRRILKEHELAIRPADGRPGYYTLTPTSTVGVVQVGDLLVSIQPKLRISRVLFLASYAFDDFRVRPEDHVIFKDAPDIMQAMARLLFVTARRAFSRGLHRGYRSREEALTTVRGRIMIAEQIRRRMGHPIPIEVRYDEFTEDITANRLVKAAAVMLARMSLRDPTARAGLHQILARLTNVGFVEYSPSDVPDVRFNRLNEHYRQVVALSRLVLRHASIEPWEAEKRETPGFLMDMNVVFEKFVERALREELNKICEGTLKGQYTTTLAKNGQVRLRPDLTFWQRRPRPGRNDFVCTFVGDAKYKRPQGRIADSDLIQVLLYTIALDLPRGLLVYADAEGSVPQPVEIRHIGKRLEAFAFNLSVSRQELLNRVRDLACQVCEMARQAERAKKAAEASKMHRCAVS